MTALSTGHGSEKIEELLLQLLDAGTVR